MRIGLYVVTEAIEACGKSMEKRSRAAYLKTARLPCRRCSVVFPTSLRVIDSSMRRASRTERSGWTS